MKFALFFTLSIDFLYDSHFDVCSFKLHGLSYFSIVSTRARDTITVGRSTERLSERLPRVVLFFDVAGTTDRETVHFEKRWSRALKL